MRMPWPVDGTLQYLRHPRWWGWPLAAMALAWIAILGAFVGVVAWQWPPEPLPGFWSRMAHIGWILWAMTKAGLAALVVYLLATPLLIGLACERLAVRVQRAAGAPAAREEPLLRAIASTARVVLNTLHLRLAWLAVAGAALLVTGPVGLLVGALAMAQIAVIDAVDVALAMRGFSGIERIRILQARAAELRAAALPAALVNVGLGLTLLGWLFWLPGLVAGAARRVLDWPEVAAHAPAEPAALAVEPLRVATEPAAGAPDPTSGAVAGAEPRDPP